MTYDYLVRVAYAPALRRVRRLLSDQASCVSLARPRKALLTSAVLVMVVLTAAPWTAAMEPAKHQPAILEFHLVDEQSNAIQAQQSGEVPSGDKVYPLRDGSAILLKRDAFVTSDEIAEVTAITTQDGLIVYVRLDARGAASMLHTTRENVGHQIAAVYNGQVINDAVIRSALGPEFELSGLTAAEARALAMQFPGVIK
jgi:preprotein translocase subunit SecD